MNRTKRHSSQSSSKPRVFASGASIVETATERLAKNEGTADVRALGEWRGLYVLIPALLVLLTSINTLWNGFASDDLQMVVNNALIKDFSNLPHAFSVSGWAFSTNDIRFALDIFYRPILNVLFTINYTLFGTIPWGWHLVSVLIHATVTLLVFMVLSELTGRRWLALIATTMFAVHPVHAESVAWVSGATDPLLAMFLLSAFYFYLKYRQRRKKYIAAIALTLCLLALLSKETALAMPLIVAYCELVYFEGTATPKQRFIRAAKVIGLLTLPCALYFLFRYLALGTLVLSGEAINPLGYALETIPLAVVKYLKLFLIPAGYSFQHDTPLVLSLASARFIVPLLVIAAVVAGILLTRSRMLAFATAWFAIWLAPSLAVLRQYEEESLVQERYLYLPSIGFCLALALGIEWLGRRERFGLSGRAVAATIAITVIGLWSVILVLQNRVWRDNITLYQNCVAVDPSSPGARTALALTYFEAGRFREADEQANAALSLDPQFLGAYLNLSYKARRLGQTDQAIQYLETAISTVPEGPLTRHKLATVYLNLGMLYGDQKKFDVAEQYLLRSVEMWPRPVGWYYAGLNYFYEERYEQAIAMYEEVIRRVSPRYAPIHLSLGAVYEKAGQVDKARAEFVKYLELAPPDAPDRKQVQDKLRQSQNKTGLGKP